LEEEEKRGGGWRDGEREEKRSSLLAKDFQRKPKAELSKKGKKKISITNEKRSA